MNSNISCFLYSSLSDAYLSFQCLLSSHTMCAVSGAEGAFKKLKTETASGGVTAGHSPTTSACPTPARRRHRTTFSQVSHRSPTTSACPTPDHLLSGQSPQSHHLSLSDTGPPSLRSVTTVPPPQPARHRPGDDTGPPSLRSVTAVPSPTGHTGHPQVRSVTIVPPLEISSRTQQVSCQKIAGAVKSMTI